MAQSLVDKDNCNFWKSWKSIKNMNVWHAKKHCVSGQVNNDNICQGFSNEFAKVFKNSWLDNNVSNKVHDVCCNIRTRKFSSTVITLGDVYDAVQKLKINKSAGLDNVFAEYIRCIMLIQCYCVSWSFFLICVVGMLTYRQIFVLAK